MARGRPPKPEALAWLSGDPGKRRRYEITPQGPTGTPDAPDYLCPIARAEWEFIVPMLSDMNVLSRIDGSALVSYCEAWARYRVAADHIATNGPLTQDGEYSPFNRIVAENQKLVKAYLIEFGMTAAARARMSIKPAEKPKASKWSGLLPINEAG